MQRTSDTRFRTISAAGFAATAITFGPARMGFGLFLPEFRADFALSTETAGVISGMGFAGFLAGLLLAQALLARFGPRWPVLVGLAAATAGTALVALAPNLWVLAAGILLAMSSAGFAWAPFNNAVNRLVSLTLRPAALSTVSSGTALGVAAAGAGMLVVSLWVLPWRLCWAAFAVAAAVAALGNWVALGPVAGSPGRAPPRRRSVMLRPAALPLYAVGLSFGLTSAIYLSFAADRVAQAGAAAFLPEGSAPAFLFIVYGLFGLLGLLTDRIREAIGLTPLLRLLSIGGAVSLLLVARAPAETGAVAASAALEGMYVMMMSAVLAFWSERLFPRRPAEGFTAALIAVAAGSVAGPLGAGYLSDAFGGETMFLTAAAAPGALAVGLSARWVRDLPVEGTAHRRREELTA